MAPKYELDANAYHPENSHYTLIKILTGLEFDDIASACLVAGSWRGSVFINVFRTLGFNVNPRFKKFDKDTQYPCLMRFKRTDVNESWWYVYAYYDGKVYLGANVVYTLDEFLKQYPHIKITSMLQVWI